MGDKTGIQWTDATWNPIRGCSRISQGCVNCYAERVAARFSGPGQPYEGLAEQRYHLNTIEHRDEQGRYLGQDDLQIYAGPRWTGEVRAIHAQLAQPLRWRRGRRIFVNSMSDLFHEALPVGEIAAVLGVMALAPHHTFQVLTKRADRMGAFFRDYHDGDYERNLNWWINEACQRLPDGLTKGIRLRERLPRVLPLPNVWLGVSAENQATADARIPHLLRTPAAIRFVSAEPLLEEIDLTRINRDSVNSIDALAGTYSYPVPIPHAQINWVIAGAESGPGARPAEVDWYRSLRDQCANAGVALFLKQAINEHYYAYAQSGMARDADGCCDIGIAPGLGSSRKPAGGGHELIGAPYLDGRQYLAFPGLDD
jgi:protein gp37